MVPTVARFGSGVADAARGVRLLLGTPRLRPLLILPFVLTIAAFVALFAGAFALRERWLELLPASGVLRALASVIAHLALLVVAYFTFLPVASLIAAPFNETIAESVEEISSGRAPPSFSLRRLARDLGLALAHELRKLIRWIVLAVTVLLLSLLPGIGPFLGILGGGYVAARFAAYDALDATFARWGWPFARKTAFIRQQRPACLGLGCVIAAMLLVPVVNALAMPVGAAAGALLALRLVPEAERGDPQVSSARR